MGLSSYKMSKILLMGRKRELCSAVELPEPNGTSYPVCGFGHCNTRRRATKMGKGLGEKPYE